MAASGFVAPASAQSNPGTTFELLAEGDSAEVALVLGGWEEANRPDSGQATNWTIRLSTPVASGDDSADFITDGGLSDSTAARASYGWLHHGAAVAGASRVPVAQVVVSGGIGYQTLTFRDHANLEKQEVTRTPYALSLSVGGEWPNRAIPFPYYLGIGVEHTREHRGPDQRTLCAPPPASGPQECFTASFGAPEAQKTTAAFLVARLQHELPIGSGIPFAVEVQPAYDFESGVSEVAATLFFFPDNDGGLRGGLRARWRSSDDDPATDDDNFMIGAFVGVPFSLYGPAGNR
jgi:hypothetical protein